MNKPLDIGFNVVSRHMARLLHPCGYDVSSMAPDTLEGVRDYVLTHGRMQIWDGACEHTIFGCAETNQDFRAWHDWCHWRLGLPFTPEGDRAVAAVMQEQVRRLWVGNPSVEYWCKIIDADVNGQAAYFEQHGRFPDDQVAVTLDWMQRQEIAVPA